MKRWLPAPWLSLGLLAGWLLLARSTGPGAWLMGGLAAVLLPLWLAPLRPRPGPLRRPGVLLRLVLRVGRDVLRSALEVAGGVARARQQPPRSALVDVPLDLRDEHALAALAIVTTVVPGTVWCELAPGRDTLRLHVFDLADEAAFIAQFKADYEHPLKEIFE